MDIEIRPELPEDYPRTENMTREAFWNNYCPGCAEHYLLHVMRDSPAFVAELNYVATDDDEVVGNIVYTKGKIMGDDGRDREVLTLGPIAVLPECQRRGIGGELIEKTAGVAKDLGYKAILLYGDPDYYSKRGFSAAEEFDIRSADDMYADSLQARELEEGSLRGAAGRYIEDPVYEIDKDAAEEFDKGFPEKRRVGGTEAQRKFEEIARRRRRR